MRSAALLMAALLLLASPTAAQDAAASFFGDDTQARAAAQHEAVAALGAHLVQPADPTSGDPFGRVTIVVFTDPMCPYCRRLLPTIEALLHEDDDVRIVWKDIAVLGPASELEARALLAAQAQSGYDRMQDAVMRTPGPLGRDALRDLADQIGLNGNRLLRDIDDPAIKARLAANLALARQLHIVATPDLIVGGELIVGAVHLDDLKRMVAAAARP